MCSRALLQLKESPGPTVPQPVLYCHVLLCKWSQTRMQVLAGHRLLAGPCSTAWTGPQDRLCQLRLLEQRGDY